MDEQEEEENDEKYELFLKNWNEGISKSRSSSYFTFALNNKIIL